MGLKDKVVDVLRAALALIDADADGSLTRDEIRVYAAKVLQGGGGGGGPDNTTGGAQGVGM